MPRTVSDQEYAYLQGKAQIADFIQPVWDNPQLNGEAKALLKKQYPNLQIPDYDIRNEWRAELAERDRQAAEAEAERQRRREDQDWQDKRAATQRRYGMTDDAMKRMEEMMVEKKVGDYDVAASYMVQKEPKPSQATWDASRWHHERQPGWELSKTQKVGLGMKFMEAINRDIERNRGNNF